MITFSLRHFGGSLQEVLPVLAFEWWFRACSHAWAPFGSRSHTQIPIPSPPRPFSAAHRFGAPTLEYANERLICCHRHCRRRRRRRRLGEINRKRLKFTFNLRRPLVATKLEFNLNIVFGFVSPARAIEIAA